MTASTAVHRLESMWLFPSRITRYVLGQLLTPTLLGLTLYAFVLLMNHFFLVAEKSLSKNLGLELTVRLFMTGVPATSGTRVRGPVISEYAPVIPVVDR